MDNIARAERLPNGLTVEQASKELNLGRGAVRLRISQNMSLGKEISGGTRWKRGAEAHAAKLQESDVKEIRRVLASGMLVADIARKYGVAWPSIDAIRKGKSWAWLK